MRVHRGLAFFLSLLIACGIRRFSTRATTGRTPPAAAKPAAKPKPPAPGRTRSAKARTHPSRARPSRHCSANMASGAPIRPRQTDGRFASRSPSRPLRKPSRPTVRAMSPTCSFPRRPADKVTNEVSIVVGYPFKPSLEATAQVGGTTFQLYTQGDGAWIKNAAEEAHMVDAMRAGDSAVVKGTSAKGTESTTRTRSRA